MTKKIIFFTAIFIHPFIISARSDPFPGLVKLLIGKHKHYPVISFKDSVIKYTDTTVFYFYNTPNDKRPSRQLKFYFDYYSSPCKERLTDTAFNLWLNPMTFDPDTTSGFFRFYFVCKSRQGDWLEVITNEKSQTSMWIRKTRHVKLIQWSKLPKENLVCINPKSILFNSADSLSGSIKIRDTDRLYLEKVKGNWMYLTLNKYDCCSYNSGNIIEGWALFKRPDQLLVDIIIK